MTTSADVRAKLVETLELDLIGPGPGHPLEAEQLRYGERPSRWYLTGFLVPSSAPEAQRHDPESAEVLDAVAGFDDGTGDDDQQPDRAPARKVFPLHRLASACSSRRESTSSRPRFGGATTHVQRLTMT